METKQQKIDRLKKEIQRLKSQREGAIICDGFDGWSPVIQGFNMKIEKLEKELKETEEALKEFKDAQSKIIYGRRDKVLKFDGEKLVELEG